MKAASKFASHLASSTACVGRIDEASKATRADKLKTKMLAVNAEPVTKDLQVSG